MLKGRVFNKDGSLRQSLFDSQKRVLNCIPVKGAHKQEQVLDVLHAVADECQDNKLIQDVSCCSINSDS